MSLYAINIISFFQDVYGCWWSIAVLDKLVVHFHHSPYIYHVAWG